MILSLESTLSLTLTLHLNLTLTLTLTLVVALSLTLTIIPTVNLTLTPTLEAHARELSGCRVALGHMQSESAPVWRAIRAFVGPSAGGRWGIAGCLLGTHC